MYLAGIAEFLLGSGGCRRLNKLAKTSSGVGESPGRQLNPKCLQRRKNQFTRRRIHGNLSCEWKIQSFYETVYQKSLEHVRPELSENLGFLIAIMRWQSWLE